jgi:hypothetical protein
MKKILIIIVLVIGSQITTLQLKAQANKQHTLSMNFGPELFAPENFWATHKVGVGLSIKTEYTFGKHASTTFNTGFTYFDGKKIFEDFTSPLPKYYDYIFAIPIKAGARYYVGNFYFLGEAGAIIMTNYSNTTKAVFSAGIGDKINIGRKKLDISARQEIWLGKNKEEYNMAVLRIAYEINF